MRRFVSFAFAATVLHAECVAVTGTRIFAGDLAKADRQYSLLPAGIVVGFAPAPGTRRVIAATELTRFARANGLTVNQAADVCFEFPVNQITRDEAAAAMRQSLPVNASIEIVTLSANGVPAGELRFPPDGLSSQHWRGYVRYAGNLRVPVWADVTLSVPVTSVVATRDLPADVALDAGAVRAEISTTSSLLEAAPLRLEDLKGLAPKSLIRAGSVIRASDLESPPSVRRGDSIRVEVESGLARLHFDAVAEGSARVGDVIELHSPVGGKPFKARLESSSRAIVVVGGKTL
jgi:flagella basal body P-ring formation protein FlgA